MNKFPIILLVLLVLVSCKKSNTTVSTPAASNPPASIANGSVGVEKLSFELNTTNVSEGLGLYFTNQRAIDALGPTLSGYVSANTLSSFAGAMASKTQIVDCSSVGIGDCIINATSNNIKVKNYSGNVIKIGNLVDGGNYRIFITDELNTELSVQSLDTSLSLRTLDPVVYRIPGRVLTFELSRVEDDLFLLYREF